jgi:predicted DNA-binding protein (MmcQ/YjbR family)
VGSSEASIKYLAPYVFRVAISNSRIVKVEDHKVFFRYKKTGSRRLRTIALPVMEFIRRFLQHVLPTGFMKVRHYGFMSPTSSVKLDEIRNLIELSYGFEIEEAAVEITPAPYMACPHCGGILKFRLWIPSMLVLQPG